MARFGFRLSVPRSARGPLAALAVILLLLAIVPAGPAAAHTTDGYADVVCPLGGSAVHHTDCAPQTDHAGCLGQGGCVATFTLPVAADLVVRAGPRRWTLADCRNPTGRSPSVTTPPPISAT